MEEEKSLLLYNPQKITTKLELEFMGDFGHCINKKFHALFSTEANYITFFEWRMTKITQKEIYSIDGYCNYFITVCIRPKLITKEKGTIAKFVF
jgi:hypothetical protein